MFNWKRTFSIFQVLLTVAVFLQFEVIMLRLSMADTAFNELQTYLSQHDKCLQNLNRRLNVIESFKRIDYK
jgi:hypothetical protein